jgi:hypothetical protein
VFVKVQFFWTTRPSKKLAEKYFSPFEIIGEARIRDYILRLPDNLWVVHLVFHVSMLEPITPNSIPNQVQSLPPPVEIHGETEYEISEKLDGTLNMSDFDVWMWLKKLFHKSWLLSTSLRPPLVSLFSDLG